MAEIERELILRTVLTPDGHRARAAELLEIGLRTLQRKLKEYGEICHRERRRRSRRSGERSSNFES